MVSFPMHHDYIYFESKMDVKTTVSSALDRLRHALDLFNIIASLKLIFQHEILADSSPVDYQEYILDIKRHNDQNVHSENGENFGNFPPNLL